MKRTERLTIAVAGATGRLGRPVALRLLERGHRVRLLSRDPDAAKWPGIAEPVRGDFDDPAGLRAAFAGVDAVFATGTAHRAGPAGEARHGTALAEAMSEARVPHLVYVSGAGAERPTGVPVFESKRAVERRIAELGLHAAILAPAYFMENAFNPWNLPALEAGRLALPLPGDRVLQQVAIEDIAAFAVRALERPAEFAGRRLELASDALTGEQAAAALSRATDRRYEFQRLALDPFPPPLRLLFEWLERTGTSVEIQTLHREHPDVGWHSFERWAAAQDWPATTSSYTRAIRSASAGQE
jgi:uncharacterized protein YbjT (DUF2867 family)